VETVQAITNLTIFLDTTNPVVLRLGLGVSRNKVMIKWFLNGSQKTAVEQLSVSVEFLPGLKIQDCILTG